MDLRIDPHGQIRCVYAEAIDLDVLGQLHIVRASHVEPDAEGQWWADLAPLGGPRLGPFHRRTEALQAACRIPIRLSPQRTESPHRTDLLQMHSPPAITF